ncbi:MAG: phytanoyl-CoA dioxygenase family protein [Flavobacteriales bacterium]|nr:phytanoyl-CoA dioxygenase family protein [Flavobacteriales bacterium]
MGGTFISKPANGKGLITPHRDWNLVDESKYRSCNIWVPLVDTSIENGAIEILPKSHLLGPLYRGPNITNQLKNVEEFLWENMQIKPMKAGYAFVYDHRFIHGSKHNNTTKERPASACAITPKEAEFRFYHKHTTTKGERIEEFESYPEYLLREDRFDSPTVLKHLRTLDVNSNYFDENHFNVLNLNSHTEKPNLQVQKEGFFQKLKSLLKA